jgi:hypothetical protein
MQTGCPRPSSLAKPEKRIFKAGGGSLAQCCGQPVASLGTGVRNKKDAGSRTRRLCQLNGAMAFGSA